MVNRIINTSKQDPLLTLAEQMFTDHPIERSEARGQQELVNSDVLPAKWMHGSKKETLEKFDVIFGSIVDGDDLFQNVTLPKGWEKITTDHSMWSRLIDDKGRERASIFYKAAFYDRSAHISLTTRYNYSAYESDEYAIAKDGEKVIFKSKPFILKDGKATYEARDQGGDEAKKWLDVNYPDWENPAKYF